LVIQFLLPFKINSFVPTSYLDLYIVSETVLESPDQQTKQMRMFVPGLHGRRIRTMIGLLGTDKDVSK
jgi:hypothetical protein